MSIKGYKVFNPDWTCRGFQYEVGKEFEHIGEIEVCQEGFHFCRDLADCFSYYAFDSNNKVAEIEATGLVKTKGNKSVTNKIKIIRELSWFEVLENCNIGNGNTGLYNTGNRNTGRFNTEDRNTGNYNTGCCNTGNYNTGCGNTNCNNIGHCNAGNYNTGNYNTGNCNRGDYNTGDWNIASNSSGFFNTITQKVTSFNKKTNLTRDEYKELRGLQVLNSNYENNWWVYSEEMTDTEKEEHPEHQAIGGYLKTIPFTDACRLMWANLNDEEKQAVYELPNFDKDIFEQITGIYIENLKSKKGNSKMRKIFGIVAKMFKIKCHHCGDVVEWQEYNTVLHRHIYKCRNCGKEWIW